ncbi:MAG: type II toxin-antitoxin system PemK/MazF family toxin [Coleofasciculaceae cyanobacterium SM2_1_6]|nr:type II toxin-antitoxin system PemK/MazF family toxin [Coleofasciculaceae cyanobacterium SM2_1_6]
MARFVKGDVVIVPFPFSDLSQNKRRPALVIANLQGDDLILCQITSQSLSDSYAIILNDNDFETGSLNKPSNIRPNRLFTADQSIILSVADHLKPTKTSEAIAKIIEIINKVS